MIQKRSRIKINTDLAKIRQAGKNPQEVQKELLEFFGGPSRRCRPGTLRPG